MRIQSASAHFVTCACIVTLGLAATAASGGVSSAQVITESSRGVPSANGNRFGATSTVGDFNCDGIDDLAIGQPFATVNGVVEAG